MNKSDRLIFRDQDLIETKASYFKNIIKMVAEVLLIQDRILAENYFQDIKELFLP